MDLNSTQKQAIQYLDGPLLVLAGAGTGKTRVITQKISYLLDQHHFNPTSILAVTFTNKAAKEMASRVQALCPQKKGSKRPIISTFHTFGLSLLKREYAKLNLNKGFTLFDAHDSFDLIKQLADTLNLSDQVLRAKQNQISMWKNACISPEHALQHAQKDDHSAAVLYEAYQTHLKAYNAVDFDDLLSLPLHLFKTHPEVLTRLQAQIRYLLVDEYQDTNHCQYRIIQALSGRLGLFTLVGDDDQSIYAWRGANSENLTQLNTDYPRLKVIKLEENYRSTHHILQCANHLIAFNPHIFEKKLWTPQLQGELVKLRQYPTHEEEVTQITNEILAKKFKEKAQFGDFAVLYRSNHQSRPLEKALRENGIPYFVSGGTSFFAYKEVKDLMAYFKLMVNPSDDAAYLRCINVPKREIGPSTLEKLGRYAKDRNTSLFEASMEMGLTAHLPPKATDKLMAFAQMIVTTEDNAQRGDTMRVLTDFVQNEINYIEWLNQQGPTPKQAEKKVQHTQELLEWLGRLIEKDPHTDASFSQVINKLILIDRLEQQEESSASAVQLSTLHAAKGLEFKHVFLMGLIEGTLPHQNSIDADTIEEERRLMYVGLTRAQESLHLSHCEKRKNFGEITLCEPSRFLSELPKDHLCQLDQTPIPEETRLEQGKAAFQSLKSLLDPMGSNSS